MMAQRDQIFGPKDLSNPKRPCSRQHRGFPEVDLNGEDLAVSRANLRDGVGNSRSAFRRLGLESGRSPTQAYCSVTHREVYGSRTHIGSAQIAWRHRVLHRPP